MHNAWTANSKICIIGPSCASRIVVSVSWCPHWCPGFTNILSPKSPTMRTECTRKLQDKPKPYVSKPGPKTPQKAPATSAISTKVWQRKNLTVNDWLTVFAFVDAHPRIHKPVYAITFTPWLMVPLNLIKQLSHGSSRCKKTLKLMQPHFRMQCQPNMSALLSALMWIGPCISGSSPWSPRARL